MSCTIVILNILFTFNLPIRNSCNAGNKEVSYKTLYYPISHTKVSLYCMARLVKCTIATLHTLCSYKILAIRGTRKLVTQYGRLVIILSFSFHIKRICYIVQRVVKCTIAILNILFTSNIIYMKSLQYEEQESWLHNILLQFQIFSSHIKRFHSIGRLIGNFTVKILCISFWNSVTWKRYKRKCFSEQYSTILAMFRSDVDLVRLDDSCSAMCTLLIRYYYIP